MTFFFFMSEKKYFLEFICTVRHISKYQKPVLIIKTACDFKANFT